MRRHHPHLLPSLSLILAMFLWGSSFIAMKLAFQDYHPMVVIFGRMLVASLAFLCFLPQFRTIRIRRQERYLFVIMALSEPCFYFFFEALALQNTSAAQAALITTMLPLLITIASVCFLGERSSRQTVIGLFLAMGGAIILSLGGEANIQAPSPLLGNFYEFMSMICATVYTITIKRLTVHYPPLFLTAIQAWVGTLFFAPFLTLSQVPLPHSFLLVPMSAILYLGLAVTLVAYSLYNFALTHMEVSKSSIFITLIPLFTLLLSRFLLQESFTLLQYIGGFTLFSGVIVSQDFFYPLAKGFFSDRKNR
ncbi:MAG: DMT family transporter [Deltaproteobacteria bacterium]|nr:DMT family transporter [Deltaproteobacteria bacterium]